MAKIKTSIGLTLRLTKENDFQFIRPEVEISEIDTDKDVPTQLQAIRAAMNPVWDETLFQINERVMNQMPHISKELSENVMNQLVAFKKQLDSALADVDKLKKFQVK